MADNFEGNIKVFPKFNQACESDASVVGNVAHVSLTIDRAPAVVATFTADASSPVESYDFAAGTEVSLKYGCSVAISAVPTGGVVIKGADYYGEPMTETVTAVGATTKAFKSITKVSSVTAGNSLVDFTISETLTSGLPIKFLSAQALTIGGEFANTSFGTAADTDAPSATTGDPRGTVDLSSAAAGDLVEMSYYTSKQLITPAAGNFDFGRTKENLVGGLHGRCQFVAG